MRRAVFLTLFLIVAVGFLAPPAMAQAPTPKVTITGVIDNLVDVNKNMNMTSFERVSRGASTGGGDEEFYGRTRGRWDIIGELGKAKAVLGLEVDLIYGQFGAADTCSGNFAPNTAAGQCGSRGDGSSGGFDADTDVRVPFELKWMYVEFPLTGPGSLMPFLPFAGSMRVGGMDYALGLKPSVLADTDFGGAQINLQLAPNVKFSLTYAQFEENFSGLRTHTVVGTSAALAAAPGNVFGRGDDWGVILKADVEPFKGLRVSPIVTFQELAGTTSGIIRIPTGGYAVSNAAFRPDLTTAATGAAGPVIADCFGLGNSTGSAGTKCRYTEEHRYTAGLDFRLDSGPFYIWPTVFYQWGERERFVPATDPGFTGGITHAHMNAWFFDVQAGFRLGPLLLEGRGLYTTGNNAKDNLNDHINYYQPFQTGNSFWNGWGDAHGAGAIDYLTSLNSFSTSTALAATPSYDRYGRIMFTLRATYSLTPAFSVYGMVTPEWTAEKVATKSEGVTANGLARTAAGGVPCDRTCGDGVDRYLGTDVTAGFTYRFAPGLTFDLAGGYLFSGDARSGVYDTGLHAGNAATGVFRQFDAKDSYQAASRVRFTF